MPVVTNTIKYPAGSVAAGSVEVELVGENGRPLTTGAFVTSGDYSIEGKSYPTITAGVWSATLVANTLINPSGTRWRITETVNGRVVTYYIAVPDAVGPHFVEDILDEPPGSVASSALQAHVDDEDAHGGVVASSRNATGTTDTAVMEDAGCLVRMTNASASVHTVPPNASVAFPVNTVYNVYAAGAGGVTITPGAGVTIRKNTIPLAQYEECSLRKDATNEWVRVG